jgi:hypothetical protein
MVRAGARFSPDLLLRQPAHILADGSSEPPRHKIRSFVFQTAATRRNAILKLDD